MPSKKDDTEEHRAEIEQWTQDGQNCEQIAAALKARGVDISAKTISRHRVAWGIRYLILLRVIYIYMPATTMGPLMGF